MAKFIKSIGYNIYNVEEILNIVSTNNSEISSKEDDWEIYAQMKCKGFTTLHDHITKEEAERLMKFYCTYLECC